MSKQIVWSPLSESDFAETLNFLHEKWSHKVALQFIERTEIILNQIAANPKQFAIINKSIKVRKCVLTKHKTLYYRTTKRAIEILRIYDNRKDPQNLTFK